MKLSSTICKAAEFGIGLIAVITLTLTGCLSGGSSSSDSASNNSSTTTSYKPNSSTAGSDTILFDSGFIICTDHTGAKRTASSVSCPNPPISGTVSCVTSPNHCSLNAASGVFVGIQSDAALSDGSPDPYNVDYYYAGIKSATVKSWVTSPKVWTDILSNPSKFDTAYSGCGATQPLVLGKDYCAIFANAVMNGATDAQANAIAANETGLPVATASSSGTGTSGTGTSGTGTSGTGTSGTGTSGTGTSGTGDAACTSNDPAFIGTWTLRDALYGTYQFSSTTYTLKSSGTCTLSYSYSACNGSIIQTYKGAANCIGTSTTAVDTQFKDTYTINTSTTPNTLVFGSALYQTWIK